MNKMYNVHWFRIQSFNSLVWDALKVRLIWENRGSYVSWIGWVCTVRQVCAMFRFQ